VKIPFPAFGIFDGSTFRIILVLFQYIGPIEKSFRFSLE
jgi:hypothetical protein